MAISLQMVTSRAITPDGLYHSVHFGTISGDSLHSRSSSLQRSRRSPSPSEYYRQRNLRSLRLEERIYELNEFIEQAVNKFLDKQSVRKLINDYNEDSGAFGGNIWNSTDSDTDQHTQYTNFLQLENRETEKLTNSRHFVTAQLTENRSTIRQKSLLELFFGLIRFKRFAINRTERRNALQVEQALADFDEKHNLDTATSNISCLSFLNFV